jgi:Family of unknown function (DUF6088)
MFSAASQIRRYLYNVEEDTLISIRRLLIYGTRRAVDGAVGRLVRAGMLQRVARGLYIKPSGMGVEFSDFEIAEAKARGFGKGVYTHGDVLAAEMGITKPLDAAVRRIFAVEGSASSFNSVNGRINLRSVCRRYLVLGERKIGRISRALISLGKDACVPQNVEPILRSLSRLERALLAGCAQWLPGWLSDILGHGVYSF